MRGRRLARAVVVLGVVVLLAAACGDDKGGGGGGAAPAGTSASTTTAAPKTGGNLTMGMFSETAGLDPVVTNGAGVTGSTEVSSIFDVIMRFNPETKKYEPRTAESLNPNADFTEWTLKLKSNVKFSDGTAYDADAVVFSMKRFTQFGSRAAGLVANIKEYAVVDPLTVKFTLSGPWSNFPYVLAYTPGNVVSPTAVKGACGANQEIRPRDCAFNTKPVGAGPFLLDSYKPKESITVKRNPAYWGGPAYLDSIKFVVLPGAPQTYDALTANTLQVGFLREPEVVKKANDDKSLDKYLNLQWAGGVALLNNGKITCKNGIPAAVCQGKPDGVIDIPTPTSDVRVRQAIAYAIDPNVINQRANNGAGFAGSDMFQKNSKWQSSAPTSTYDVAKAKALVDQVKKEKNWDGTLRVNCHNAPSRQSWAIAAQTLLEAAGFKVQLKNDYDVNGLVADVNNNKSYDVACWGLNVAEEAPEIGLSQQMLSTSAGNGMNVNNPDIDTQINAVRTAKTDADKKAALDKLQEIWRTQEPSVIYEASPEMIASRHEVHGLTFTISTVVLYDKAWLG